MRRTSAFDALYETVATDLGKHMAFRETFAADTCTQAGMLSTLATLRGAEAEAFLAAQGARFWCDR